MVVLTGTIMTMSGESGSRTHRTLAGFSFVDCRACHMPNLSDKKVSGPHCGFGVRSTYKNRSPIEPALDDGPWKDSSSNAFNCTPNVKEWSQEYFAQ
jgi:hypothetical protein